jgi:hypothetical protein
MTVGGMNDEGDNNQHASNIAVLVTQEYLKKKKIGNEKKSRNGL